MLVIVTKAGETAPSLKPRRKRTVAKPAKLVGAARYIHTIPQIILDFFFEQVSRLLQGMQTMKDMTRLTHTVAPTNLVSGSRLIK